MLRFSIRTLEAHRRSWRSSALAGRSAAAQVNLLWYKEVAEGRPDLRLQRPEHVQVVARPPGRSASRSRA